MKKTKGKAKQSIFTYLNDENMEHVKKLTEKYNQSITYVMDQLVTAHRTGTEATFELWVPACVRQARKWTMQNKRYRQKYY
jgi:hypothetical protein